MGLLSRGTGQRMRAFLPPQSWLDGVAAKEGTFCHLVELTIDQFGGAGVLCKRPMFIHYRDYTVEASLLDEMRQEAKLFKYT